jgi:hypothetical protein
MAMTVQQIHPVAHLPWVLVVLGRNNPHSIGFSGGPMGLR